MGPHSTLDFMQKMLCATPAKRDQRSDAYCGRGPSPLPALVERMSRLVRAGAEVIDAL
jgi:hypothetical protein